MNSRNTASQLNPSSRSVADLVPSSRLLQVSWLVVAVSLIMWGLRLWTAGTMTAAAPIPSVLLAGGGMASLVVPSLLRRKKAWRAWEAIMLALVVGALFVWVYTQIYANPSYLTDEMAFDQWAATLWVHGINPYGRSLAAAFTAYQVSPDKFTWTLTGTPVTLLSYPALAFELYAPAIALGWTSQVAVWFNVTAWALGIVLAYYAVPRSVRPWILVLGSFSVYIGFAQGGVTDALYVPFLVLAAWKWDRYPLKQGWAAVWPAVWMGLALGIKQTPWVLWPFLVMGFILEGRRRGMDTQAIKRMVGRYTLISGGVFLLPNLPFLFANPGSWLRGILAPLISKTVPDGQGLITVSLFEPWGSGSLEAYTILSLVVLVTLLVLYPLTYPRLKAATFLLPSVALFFATRSFASYLLMLIPAAVVAVATTRPAGRAEPLGRSSRYAVWAGGIASGVAVAAALLLPGPVRLQLSGIHTSGQLATVDRVTVTATNTGGAVVHPTFTADVGGDLTAFWRPLSGPSALGPHQTATYVLAAPNLEAMPPISGGFQMMLFTPKSETMSRTAIVLPTAWHLSITPDAVNRFVAKGTPVHFTVNILNRWDQPVHVSGIPIYFGQVVYAQHGAQLAQSAINRGYVGETPVSALTNRNGIAQFTVRDLNPQADPVYYEANLVSSQDFYPYGYSPIVAVRFVH